VVGRPRRTDPFCYSAGLREQGALGSVLAGSLCGSRRSQIVNGGGRIAPPPSPRESACDAACWGSRVSTPLLEAAQWFPIPSNLRFEESHRTTLEPVHLPHDGQEGRGAAGDRAEICLLAVFGGDEESLRPHERSLACCRDRDWLP